MLQGFFIRVRPILGHSHQIYDLSVGRRQLYMRRSMFGLIAYYNRLPQRIVDITNVSLFQSELQILVRRAVVERRPSWQKLFRV